MSHSNPIKIIEKISEPIAAGPILKYKPVHTLEAINLIGTQPIGRIKLTRKLGLGEGVTRTLLKHLKDNELITVDRRLGCKLTKYGKEIFKFIRSKISDIIEIPEISITLGEYNVAVLIRKSSGAVKNGLEQRDAAIKTGAVGATTLIFKNKNFHMPGGGDDCLEKMPRVREVIISNLHPENGDVIIIGSGETRIVAEMGAKAAAMETLKHLKN